MAETLIPRPDPHREGNPSEMGVLSGVGWANWLAERGITPREVPGEFWAQDGDYAVLSCPCGAEPRVRNLAAPSECEGDDCGRYFFYAGDRAYAFNSPTPTSAVEDPEPEA